MKLHILAIGAHPDDVELGCSGTLIKHITKGQKAGILDLTEGELGSRGTIDTRYAEAAAAGKAMGISVRENLKMQDGFFQNDKAHQLMIVRILRKYQPDIVLANAYHDRHPDHGRASRLIEDACFLSGLRKVETEDGGIKQEAWRPAKVFHYIQDRYIQPDFIVDISTSFAQKMEAVRCFSTQFSDKGEGPVTYISQPGFLENIESRARQFGHAISATYGEGFCSLSALGIEDLDHFSYTGLV